MTERGEVDRREAARRRERSEARTAPLGTTGQRDVLIVAAHHLGAMVRDLGSRRRRWLGPEALA